MAPASLASRDAGASFAMLTAQAFACVEGQVMVAVKAPLREQLADQRVLSRIAPEIEAVCVMDRVVQEGY